MSIQERIQIIVDKLFDGNKNKFAKAINEAPTSISNILGGRQSVPSAKFLESITNSIENINSTWLLTGNGEMLTSDIKKDDTDTDESNISEDIKYRLVPILNLDSVGGIHSANQIVDVPERIIGYEPFSDALKTDKCLVESGDSMTPTIPAGSLMLIREVPNWREYFGYGNVFVILLNDGRRITKEVTRYEENAKDYVWCKSHNPLVPDEELPKSMIVSVWKVIKVLTNKGW